MNDARDPSIMAKLLDERFTAFVTALDDLESVDQLDIVVLKSQVIIEDRLRHLLASRLRVPLVAAERTLKNASIRMMLDLAIPEEEFELFRDATLALADARNIVGHRIVQLSSGEFEKNVRNFVRLMSYCCEDASNPNAKLQGRVRAAGAYLAWFLEFTRDEMDEGVFFTPTSTARLIARQGSEKRKSGKR